MKVKRFEQLNESYNENNTHVTEIERVNASFYSQELVYSGINDTYIKKCVVYWSSSVDISNSGIMGLSATIEKIVVDVEFEYYDDATDKESFEDKEIIFDGTDLEFDIDEDSLGKVPFLPESVDFDFKRNKIDITF